MSIFSGYGTENLPIERDKEFLKIVKKFNKPGVKHISYGVVTPDQKVNIYFSDPLWCKIYKEKSFLNRDPSLFFFMKSKRVVFPWISLENSEVIQRRLQECGLKDGITIYSRIDGGGGTFLELGVEKEKEMKSLIMKFPTSEVRAGMEALARLHKRVLGERRSFISIIEVVKKWGSDMRKTFQHFRLLKLKEQGYHLLRGKVCCLPNDSHKDSVSLMSVPLI